MNKTNKPKRLLFIILLFSAVVTSNLFSQNNYKRRISISEWIEEMEKCKDPVFRIANTEIYFDSNKDTLYSWKQARVLNLGLPPEKIIDIHPIVIMHNCQLPNPTSIISNVNFQNNLIFSYCEGAKQLIFYNCTFNQGLEFHHSDFKSMQFEQCSILQRVIVLELQINFLSFSNCSLYTDYKVPKSEFYLGFEKENHKYQYLFWIAQSQKKVDNFILSECKFLPTKVKPILKFEGGKYDVISIDKTDFSNSILDFSNCSVKENLTVQNCKFRQPLGMHKFNFPKDNSSFHWSQLDSVGLGLYEYYEQPYTCKTDTLISDVNLFNELNSSYRRLFMMYKTLGDIESANACYIQMKDMETQRYHHLYMNDPEINKWFNWRFNQFLDYFSEYGTNPVRSLIISMWAILIFSAVYFFFYSNWDNINRSFLIKQHRKVIKYFRSEQKLEDFYTEHYIEDLKDFAEYKKEMKESKGELPLFILFLGKPLYLLSVIRYRLLTFIYRRTEILHGCWVDLKPGRKVFVAIVVVISIAIYISVLGFIRALNSTILSINAFSTLGFGAIPVKGMSRYITIIEGFIGWFLLSIFSVSLISQMLQN